MKLSRRASHLWDEKRFIEIKLKPFQFHGGITPSVALLLHASRRVASLYIHAEISNVALPRSLRTTVDLQLVQIRYRPAVAARDSALRSAAPT